MKEMSGEKRGSVDCNGDFLLLKGDKWCGFGGYYSTKDSKTFLNPCTSNIEIGISVWKTLGKSINLPYSKETMELFMEESEEEWIVQFKYLKNIYGYKTKTAAYRNMHSCTLALNDGKLKIAPMYRKGTGAWNGLDAKYDIILRSDVSPELLGATVRYAFTLCRGQGVNVVTKALFPDVVPNSLEEYLESVDPDYERWLIAG
jgi:hypothetical protein